MKLDQIQSPKVNQRQTEPTITIPADAVMKCVLEAVDCLLMMESLKEDSLMEEEAHSLRGAGDRKRRQGNLSARVILRTTHSEHRSRFSPASPAEWR